MWTSAIPTFVMVGAFVLFVFTALQIISQRNSRTQERLERHSRPASLAEIEIPGKLSREERLPGLKKAIEDLGKFGQPQSESEQSELKIRLANAGFRSETAPGVYLGLRFACLALFFLIAVFGYLIPQGMNGTTIKWTVFLTCIGFFTPTYVLKFLAKRRQEEIFLTLPDALDLLVVCVESGLGLDAAMRKVNEEMTDHAKVLCEELSLANFQLQMGRPRREVLHDLGVRTGVDDVKSLAAILIQADRFGSSIAQALRVQSDSMRIKRRQMAEEKAAKTAVQLIFPLVLFIFPGIFVVLVGPAAIQIMDQLINKKK